MAVELTPKRRFVFTIPPLPHTIVQEPFDGDRPEPHTMAGDALTLGELFDLEEWHPAFIFVNANGLNIMDEDADMDEDI